MKLQIKTIRKLFKNKNAVSQVLSAMMMIFMFMAAIGVVWAWLYPSYQNFQTTNTVNSMTAYMLRIDESIYELYGEGIGSVETIRVDPDFGRVEYEVGRNVSLRFADEGGTFNQTYTMLELGLLSYILENRRGIRLQEGGSEYMKGPEVQDIFFVNGSTSGEHYQGLTSLLMTRPESKMMRMELEYRTRVYYWYDSINDVLSITINIIQLDIKGTDLEFHSYQTLKTNYNSSTTIYSSSTTVGTDFYVDGSTTGFNSTERPLVFVKPGTVANYDVNIEVVVSQFLFFI